MDERVIAARQLYHELNITSRVYALHRCMGRRERVGIPHVRGKHDPAEITSGRRVGRGRGYFVIWVGIRGAEKEEGSKEEDERETVND